MSSLLIVTDTWTPQINGVVRSLEFTVQELCAMGMRVEILSPYDFKTIPCPSYPEIRLSITHRRALSRKMAALACEHLHIATEGPLGLLAGAIARKQGLPYTTCYHTRFPDYVEARIPARITGRLSRMGVNGLHAWFRRFHNFGNGCLVATETLRAELAHRGYRGLKLWSRGVDTKLFHPNAHQDFPLPDLPQNMPRPLFLSVGRVAVEKNIPAFLDLDLPGSKLVVGDGPQLKQLQADYPHVTFTGAKTGKELAALYAHADVFVFPSRTDTFGLVLLEALASGLPVAAYPTMGPQEVLGDSTVGVLSEDLQDAALKALAIPRERCRDWALKFSWRATTEQFLHHITVSDRHM